MDCFLKHAVCFCRSPLVKQGKADRAVTTLHVRFLFAFEGELKCLLCESLPLVRETSQTPNHRVIKQHLKCLLTRSQVHHKVMQLLRIRRVAGEHQKEAGEPQIEDGAILGKLLCQVGNLAVFPNEREYAGLAGLYFIFCQEQATVIQLFREDSICGFEVTSPDVLLNC